MVVAPALDSVSADDIGSTLERLVTTFIHVAKTKLVMMYRPILDIVVAPVTRHLVMQAGMLVGKRLQWLQLQTEDSTYQ